MSRVFVLMLSTPSFSLEKDPAEQEKCLTMTGKPMVTTKMATVISTFAVSYSVSSAFSICDSPYRPVNLSGEDSG